MSGEMNGWDETGETRETGGRVAREAGAAAGQVDLWRGLLSEGEPPVESEVREPLDEAEYPPEVREQVAAAEDATARRHLLMVVDGLYADRTRSTEAERGAFRSEITRLTELGGGSLTRGLLRDLSYERGEPVDGAETAWPEPVASVLTELSDPRARAQLQHRASRICPDPERATPEQVALLERMVTAYRRRGDVQGALIREWLQHNPERRPHGDQAAELPAWRERCEALRDRYAKGHPGVTGCERLAKRIADQMDGPLYEMETGRRDADGTGVNALGESFRVSPASGIRRWSRARLVQWRWDGSSSIPTAGLETGGSSTWMSWRARAGSGKR